MKTAVPIVVLALVVALVPSTDPARGCAPVFRHGGYVGIASETAIIAYDAATKTEHFTRRAAFQSTAADFGFLVPTPSVPDLAEAKEATFNSLEWQTAPRHVYTTVERTEFGFGGCGMNSKFDAGDAMPTAMAPAPKSAPVEVLKKQKVGAYEAVVLKASDAAKLTEWLGTNGYQSRPELTDWLAKYVADKWVLTAFKLSVAPSVAQARVPSPEGSAVRMSFQTDRPIYPYREPADMRKPEAAANRLLRVYFISDKRYEGTLGASGDWPGRAVWANAVAPNVVADAIGGKAEGTWFLTEFEDRASPRPGTDEVYFAPATSQATMERPPIVHTTYTVRYIPGAIGGLVLLLLIPIAGVGLIVLVVRVLRKKA